MSFDIRVMKMVTGEEVIANVTTTGPGSLLLSKPRVVHLVPTQQGASMHLMPWINVMPDADAPVSSTDIVTMIKADGEVQKAYLRSTTGLDLSPTAGGSIIHS